MPDGQNRHEEAPSTKVMETCLDDTPRGSFLIIKKIRRGKKLIELQDHEESRPIQECQMNTYE